MEEGQGPPSSGLFPHLANFCFLKIQLSYEGFSPFLLGVQLLWSHKTLRSLHHNTFSRFVITPLLLGQEEIKALHLHRGGKGVQDSNQSPQNFYI